MIKLQCWVHNPLTDVYESHLAWGNVLIELRLAYTKINFSKGIQDLLQPFNAYYGGDDIITNYIVFPDQKMLDWFLIKYSS
jgi:hypothetical protein